MFVGCRFYQSLTCAKHKKAIIKNYRFIGKIVKCSIK